MGCAMPRSIGFLDKQRQGNLTPDGQTALYPREVDIKEWLVAARKHGDFTQDDIGALVGRTKSNISGWENGLHEPSFSQMVTISVAARFPLPAAGYRPKKAFSPYATAVAELIDKQPEEDRKACGTVARRAIDQHLKDRRQAATKTGQSSSTEEAHADASEELR
jgi:transcriptional regulator with XRE-family HTH domain